MSASRLRLILGLAAFLAVTPTLPAQNGPHIGYVYPAAVARALRFRWWLAGSS